MNQKEIKIISFGTTYKYSNFFLEVRLLLEKSRMDYVKESTDYNFHNFGNGFVS
tara:strand:- start:828 stop:989 length:162 start_codon:yes stop_codon:yes gene_type:complete